jgi:Tol biopolymer transport system component
MKPNFFHSKKLTLAIFIISFPVFSICAQPAPREQSHPQEKTASEIITAGAGPKLFLQEGVSAPNNQSVPTFTPDGNTVYLADNYKISVSKKVNGKWTHPTPISFTGEYKDWDPALTMDGRRLIFVSNRPWTDHKTNDLWYADLLSPDTWSAPRHLEGPVNTNGAPTYAPSISSKGTICFCSRDRDGNKGMRGYMSKCNNGQYEAPVLLRLNGDAEIYDPFIAPDERYIIFASNKDLFISYRQGDGWSAGQKLGTQVNNGKENGSPVVSPDGKMLYYSSSATDGILMIPIHIPKT